MAGNRITFHISFELSQSEERTYHTLIHTQRERVCGGATGPRAVGTDRAHRSHHKIGHHKSRNAVGGTRQESDGEWQWEDWWD